MPFIFTKIHFNDLMEFEKSLLTIDAKLRNEKFKYKFKMFDDGILNLEGLSTNSTTFDPLDDFGTSYGCTEIHYLINGKYQQL